ncbi:MAG: carbohydrate ABC transporter permease [Clostridiales bacterium]|jgi:putative aldouronate transport system permease protein|nr:carbohydrate ABC transporter permease [Clostridiales bacterium]
MLKNKNGESLIVDAIMYFVFTLLILLCVFPFYYILINTLSSNELVSQGKILLVPKEIHFQNYVEIFKLRGLPLAALISIGRTVLGTVATIIASCFLGYAMSRREFWGRSFWYKFIVVTMYFNAGIIPWFMNMKNLGMLDNFWAYVIPTAVSPFYIMLFKTYCESLSPSLEESAEMDGAGYLVRFTRIIFPLSAPIAATVAVFAAVGQWNSFTDTLFLVKSSKLYTLQFLLYQYLNEANALAKALRSNSAMLGSINMSRTLTPVSVRMTITVVVVFPILLIYPFFQRFFVKGIMVGAVKG